VVVSLPKLAANLSLLFTEVPFLERFAAAAAAGFRAVEYQFPYDFAADEIARSARAAGVAVVLHNLPRGRGGEIGIAALPGREAEFAAGVEQGIAYAQAAGCPRLNCLAGCGGDQATFVANLRVAAARLAAVDLALVIEAISTQAVPGFFLNRSAQAVEVIAEVGSDNLALQYDCFHMQRMEGDLEATIARLLPHIGHIQIADAPDRHEPGTGCIDYPHLLPALDDLGYSGYVGCEYLPAHGTQAGLGWAARWLA